MSLKEKNPGSGDSDIVVWCVETVEVGCGCGGGAGVLRRDADVVSSRRRCMTWQCGGEAGEGLVVNVC